MILHLRFLKDLHFAVSAFSADLFQMGCNRTLKPKLERKTCTNVKLQLTFCFDLAEILKLIYRHPTEVRQFSDLKRLIKIKGCVDLHKAFLGHVTW